jgi:hypothetical protein
MSISSQSISTQASALVRGVPPLENGDQLTRPEFERRYEAMSDLKKAELIAGVLQTFGDGVASREHAEFVQRMTQAP